jgi:putative molybdopterin biosynthesis protein
VLFVPSTRPSLIRERRLLQGWTQAELARRLGVSRQAFNAIEAGRAQPSMQTALALARLLGCTVERLLAPEARATDLPPLRAEAPGARFWLAEVDGRVHPHRLDASSGEAADAVVDAQRRLEMLDTESWRGLLLIAGCDPALRTLAVRAGRARWMATGTGNAVSLFLDRRIHLAGVHSLTDRDRRRVRGAVTLHLATWPLGFAVRRSNPLGIERADDLGRREVRMVNRERGASARMLLDRMLREVGLVPEAVRGYRDEVLGHAAVAQAVALGAADVGVTTQAAAQAHGLDFRQLSEESFNLLVHPDDVERPELRGLLATARSTGFRRDVGALPGYGTSRSGEWVSRT